MSKPKQPQVLEINPSFELRFQGPFSEVVTSNLQLFNPSDKRVCFKVKTTAPRRYCVRPNSGIVEPQSTVNVSVMLQPIEGDINDKGKHKFMIQSMFAPETVEDMEKLWNDASSSDIMDTKLRCVFEENPAPVADEACEEAEEVVVESEKPKDNPKTELRLLMEECKRLQAESSKYKNLYDQIKCQTRGTKGGYEELMTVVQTHIMVVAIFIIFTFGFGLMIGVSI